MALIICPECSRQVSEHAPNCPHCGYPIAGNPICTRTSAGSATNASTVSRPGEEIVLERSSTRNSASGTTATYSAAGNYNGGYKNEGMPEPDGKGKRHSGVQTFLLALLGFIIALVIVMFITCPSDGDHRREVRQLGERAVKMYASKQNNVLVTGMAFAFGDDLVDMVISKLLEVDNYGVVSIGRLENPKRPDKTQIISVGVFGHVFTASPEELVEGLSNKLKSLQEEAVDEAEREVKNKVDEAIEEAKENARKRTEKITNEVQEQIEKTTKEVNEAVEQATEEIFESINEEEKQNGHNVEKP